jgi:hypothetical protein
MTLETEIKKYVDAVSTASPNAWGQIIIDGQQSHAFLWGLQRKHGEAVVQVALDAAFAAQRRQLSHKQF